MTVSGILGWEEAPVLWGSPSILNALSQGERKLLPPYRPSGFRSRIGVRGWLFAGMTNSGGTELWLGRVNQHGGFCHAPPPAGDEPLASRSLRPRYIPLTHTPSGFQPRIGVRGRLFAGMTK